MRIAMLLLLAGLLAFSTEKAADASGPNEWREQINQGTVSIISGGINGTYIRVATDLASVLDDGNKLRVLPIMGKGSVQNIDDILYLRGIDVGIVQSDVFEFVKVQGKHPTIDSHVRYITKLYNEEFHLLAGPGIDSIDDLVNKKVNFGVSGSGTYMTASLVFNIMGLDVEATTFDHRQLDGRFRKGQPVGAVRNLDPSSRGDA